jgi:phosphopantetheinyl transferase (holo-ACP synthase)
MKKVLAVFMFVFLLIPGIASAQEQTETTTIKRVYYDTEVKAYYIETAPDENGQSWYLGLLYANKENKALTKALQQALLKKNVEVAYEDYESDNPEDWEMLEFVVLD